MNTRNDALLTQEEEIRLANLISLGQSAEKKLSQLGDNISKDEYDILMAKVSEGIKARDSLVCANMKFVSYIATGYVNQGVEFEDLFQSGSMGLVTAANKFSSTAGTRFSTYAAFWIKQNIARTIATEGRAVRLPDHVHKEVNKYKKVYAKLEVELSRKPTDKEVALKLNVSEEHIKELSSYIYSIESLDKESSSDKETTFGDLIPDKDSSSPLKYTMDKKMNSTLDKTLGEVLNNRESFIVKSYFGLDGIKPLTYEEISISLKISRERARQIVSSSLAKIRNSKYADELHNMLISNYN